MVLQDAFTPLQSLFLQHADATLGASGDWPTHGLFAKAAVNAIAELLPLIAPADALPAGSRELLEKAHACSVAAMAQRPPAAPLPDRSAGAAWAALAARLFERLAKCVISYLDNFPVQFAGYVPYFLSLYAQSAVIALDAATIRNMRPKLRVMLARCALQPWFDVFIFDPVKI